MVFDILVIQKLDPSMLSHKKLVENASSMATDAVCTLYQQAAIALMDIEEEFAQVWNAASASV